MSSLFEPWDREPEARLPRLAVELRAAARDDVDAIAAIAAERTGIGVDGVRAGLIRELTAPHQGSLWVAQAETGIVGYGRTVFLHGTDEPRTPPEGWYLGGVVVDPSVRRRGVGQALTIARMQQLVGVADEVWFFANPRNEASIALHARLGFVRVRTDLHVPGVRFRGGGAGHLFRADLRAGVLPG